MTVPLPPDHQQQTHPMNNPVTRPYSITRTHSDHPNPPLHQVVDPNHPEVQELPGDVDILDKLLLELPRLPHLIEGGVWKIRCILLGMLWMVGMLELMGILRGWPRLFRVRRGRSRQMGSPRSRERSDLRLAVICGEQEWTMMGRGGG
jgi:hypothetical protein